MRSSQSSPAVVLGIPRVRAARPAPVAAPAPRRAPEPEIEVDVEVEVELAPEPTRAPMRSATPPVSVRVRHQTLTPPAAFSLPTPPLSYPPPSPSQPLLTPAEGVALPPRGTSGGDVEALVWLSRVARSIPTRVAEHFVTFGVATFSFAFLAAVIATFGGTEARTESTTNATQEPRAGYTRPAVEKIATGAPLAETGVPTSPSQTLGMMQVKPPARTVTINRVNAAAAPLEAVRRASPPPPPPPAALATADDIPQDREPAQTAVRPKAPVVTTAAPAAPPATPTAKVAHVSSPPVRHDAPPAPPPPPARPHVAPDPKGSTESGMAQRALDEARGEDTSLSGH